MIFSVKPFSENKLMLGKAFEVNTLLYFFFIEIYILICVDLIISNFPWQRCYTKHLPHLAIVSKYDKSQFLSTVNVEPTQISIEKHV